jgi:Ca-activated chloride channel family protein
MIRFAHPAFLLLLLAVPPLIWWWLRRRRPALRYPDLGLLSDLPSGRSRLAYWGGAGLRAAALTLLILALAGPRWPDRSTPISAEGISIVMLLDASGSMNEPFGDWQDEPINRLDAVKKVFRLFVEGGAGPNDEQLPGRPSDLIGLIAFAHRPDCVCPLTLSHSALLRLLDEEKLRPSGESDTNISDAIVLGLHRLQNAGTRRKVMVLLSDGEHNVVNPQSEWTPRQAAQISANLRIPIYTIDAGGDIPETTSEGVPGKKTLQAVAEITRGKYFEARDSATLVPVCREIDALERQEIQSHQHRDFYEAFAWFGLASLTLIGLVNALELTVWQKLP